MAHIHLEDGALSPIWVVFWWAVAAALIGFALLSLRRERVPTRRMTVAAMCAAVGIAVFLVTIPVFGGIHLNLTPLIGILAGPALGSLATLIINLFSAAVGHGGWGVIGVNTVVNLIEVLVGYYAYRALRTRARVSRFSSGFSAAALALTLSAVIVVIIIAVAGVQDSHLDEEETAHNLWVIAAVNIGVGVVEGVITGYVVSFIGRIKPDLLEETERGAGDSSGKETPEGTAEQDGGG
ncbi:TPA: energy-coupling factor ABC transporter permease [Thermoplasmata archaeon]|nr:energy-coupling factor ABC transporter permease [Thermoplasmata archaeon]